MKIISYIIGIIVTLAGVIGFFGDSIIGIIDTNNIQNIVYVVLGLVLIMSLKKGQVMTTKIVGIIFVILGILGLVLSGDTVLGLAQNTGAGNYFHLIVGIIILIIAFMNKGGSQESSMHSEEINMPQQPETPQQPPHNPQM